MRIQKTKYYIIEKTPGLSGFQQWDKKDRYIVTGHKAQHERAYVVCQFNPTFSPFPQALMFRLENGRLPEYQPTVNVRQALDWLDNNKFSRVYVGNC